MKVYRRYFRVTEGPLIDAVKECLVINDAAKKEYNAILSKIGAEEGYYLNDHRLVAFTFPESPDPKVFKKHPKTPDGWHPKKNCKEGKEIAKAIEAVKTKNVNDCMATVGLNFSLRIISDNIGHKAAMFVIPADPMTIFVSVPWYDEAPEELEKYRKDRKAGRRLCMNFDAVLWEPTPEMTEVKGWEAEKAVQEWNDSLKSKNAA